MIRPLALVTIFVTGFVNGQFLMQESANITSNEESDMMTADQAQYNSSISYAEYDCISCLNGGNYYCEYSESYNTGNCDTTSFYWCTTQFHGIPWMYDCLQTFGSGPAQYFDGSTLITQVFNYNDVRVVFDSNSIKFPDMKAGTKISFSITNVSGKTLKWRLPVYTYFQIYEKRSDGTMVNIYGYDYTWLNGQEIKFYYVSQSSSTYTIPILIA